MPQGTAQVKQSATATHDEFAIIGVDDATGAPSVGVEFERVVAQMKKPRLRIMAGRGQQAVPEEELPLLSCCAIGREVLGRKVPWVSGHSFHKSSSSLNVSDLLHGLNLSSPRSTHFPWIAKSCA